VILRDVLKYATTGREAKMIVKQGKVKIDGKARLDERFPVGLMDVVTLPDTGENYRALPEKGSRLILNPIKSDEASFKLCQIKGKNILPNGVVQLQMHDGRTINVQPNESYKVNDVVKLKIPEQEILGYIAFKEKIQSIITGGRSQGETGLIVGLGSESGRKRTATVRTQKGEDIRTLAKYVFPLGTETPMISLPGEA
jgi:small subunit ribosomal protein S4e